MVADVSRADDFAPVEPWRPPWYPHDDDPWRIVLVSSGDVVTRYSEWTRSLPPGELDRLIAEHQRPACECGASAGESCPGEPLPCSRPTP